MALVRGGGLWLENVDQTHLVLASGLKMLMKKDTLSWGSG